MWLEIKLSLLMMMMNDAWFTKQAWRWGWYECPPPLHALAQNESSPFECIPSSPATIHASMRNYADPPLRCCFSSTSSSLVHPLLFSHGKSLEVSFSWAQSHVRIQKRGKQFQEWGRKAFHHQHANQRSRWRRCTYSKASCWICFQETLRKSDKRQQETRQFQHRGHKSKNMFFWVSYSIKDVLERWKVIPRIGIRSVSTVH